MMASGSARQTKGLASVALCSTLVPGVGGTVSLGAIFAADSDVIARPEIGDTYRVKTSLASPRRGSLFVDATPDGAD